MTSRYLNIGQAAATAGLTPKMVRHYESLGLIPEAERTEAGYRLYGDREVGLLRFIRQCRTLGFSMAQIQDLLQLWTDEGRPSRAVKALARRQLEALEQRRRELEQMGAALAAMVEACVGDEGSDCAILDRLQSPVAEGQRQASLHGPAATLKQVAPGTRRPRQRRPAQAPAAPRPGSAAHALAAWSHAAVSAA